MKSKPLGEEGSGSGFQCTHHTLHSDGLLP